MIKFFIVAASAFLLAPSVSHSAQIEKINLPYGIENFSEFNCMIDANRIKEATENLESQDHASALYTKGMMYLLAKCENYDAKRALEYLQKSAEKNYLRASANLAKIYVTGFAGVEKNQKKALELIERTFNAANEDERLELIGLIEAGSLGVKDFDLVISYLGKMAEQNSVKALNKLAYMYRTGAGTQKSAEKAIEYFEKVYKAGGDQDKKTSALIIVAMYFDGNEIKQDNEKGIEWLKKIATEINDADAQLRLGYIYRDGKQTAQNYKTAFEWFSKASENKVAAAKTNLGYFYINGFGVDKNIEKGRDYYIDATLLEDENAAWYLAQMYSEAQGVEKNSIEAEKWLKKYEILKNNKNRKE